MLRKITNVWTIYRFNSDGTEADQPFAALSRPQDWGDSSRWKYRVYTLHATIDGENYENEVHCWAELPLEDFRMLEMFSPLICQIMLPGTPEQLCSNNYLNETDFWTDAWGPMPDYWIPGRNN